MLPERTEIVIVGAGFAGAATAYALAKRGVREIVILEREAGFGFHSSGRNAAFLRTTVTDPLDSTMAQQTLQLVRHAELLFGEAIDYHACGHMSVGRPEDMPFLEAEVRATAAIGLDLQVLDRDGVIERCSALASSSFTCGVFNGVDGVVDIHRLLHGYLTAARAGGVRVIYNCGVSEIETSGGRVTALRTNRGRIACSWLVNAAGAWAGELGRRAGASPMPLTPCRRHLMTTPPSDWVERDWPMVWTVDNQFYFRPESGGLMLSACDQEPMAACEPPVDPTILDVLAERVTAELPQFDRVEIQRTWACLRTLTADHQFIIGPDPILAGFFWVAGLGGHGVSASAALGEIAADRLLGQRTLRYDASATDSARFAAS
ncbi:MAG: FAD-binding oxidoreductase [Myxococcales bacterium]|nr:FAD-binding oxidoreductase [Myxococcales bacterium]